MIMLQLSSDVRGHTPDKGGAKRRGDIAKTLCGQCLSNIYAQIWVRCVVCIYIFCSFNIDIDN